MPSSSWSLQQAIWVALSTAPGLVALLGVPRVFDDVPQGIDPPYITIGQSTVADWSTGTEDGEEHQLTLHVWSRAGGRKETHEIMGAIRAALDGHYLALAGHRLINLRHQLSEVRRDPDGETLHGIVRLRAVTEPV